MIPCVKNVKNKQVQKQKLDQGNDWENYQSRKVGVTTNGWRVLFGGNQIFKQVDYDDNNKTL